MKIYLTGQNNFGNRGCEALVRSTVDLVRSRYPDAQFLVPTFNGARDGAQWPEAAVSGVRFVQAPVTPRRFVNWSRVCSRLPLLTGLPWPRFGGQEAFVADMQSCDMVLSIGGDNYSLDYDLGSLALFVAIAEAAIALGKPVLLWGASVGPFTAIPGVERHMARHLQRLRAVTVRESHSLRYLAAIGVERNVQQVADSAFLLQRQTFEASAFWPSGKGKVLGFNMSPLVDAVRRRSGSSTDLIDECAAFIRRASTEFQLQVVLVPHVAPLDPTASTDNSDEAYLARLAVAVGADLPCVQVPSGLNACQLKDLIARCDYFIGARTHATIAALSSGLPTLSIAYSVKARGINLDLFGHEDVVLDTRNVNSDTLTAGLQLLITQDEALRAQLKHRLIEWKQKIVAGTDVLATGAAL